MAKTPKKKKEMTSVENELKHEFFEEYMKYSKAHEKRMRRLRREAEGSNLDSPPEADYDI